MVVPGRLSKWKVGIGTSGGESQSDPKKCSSCFCCRQCIGVNGAESETIRMTKESENSVVVRRETRRPGPSDENDEGREAGGRKGPGRSSSRLGRGGHVLRRAGERSAPRTEPLKETAPCPCLVLLCRGVAGPLPCASDPSLPRALGARRWPGAHTQSP